MLAASTIAIFVVPVLYVSITRLSYGKKKLEWLKEHHDFLLEKEKKVEKKDRKSKKTGKSWLLLA